MITWERLHLGSWNFIGTFIMTGKWPLLIFRSQGQKSRSQWLNTVKWFTTTTTTTVVHSDKKRIHTMAATTTYSRYRGMHVLQTALVMLAIICSWYVFSRDVIDFDNISTICNCRFVFNINFEILSIVYLITSQVEILT